MNDRLKQLIEQSDLAPLDAEVSARELAARVRVLGRQRMQRRLVAAAAIVATAAVALLYAGLPIGHPHRAGAQGDGPAVASEASVQKHERDGAGANAVSQTSLDNERALGDARQQIEHAETVIAKLLLAERRRQLATLTESAKVGLDLQSRYEDEIGPAAAALLVTGDERAKRPDRTAAARKDYACVIETFPNTIWAARAAERLAALKH